MKREEKKGEGEEERWPYPKITTFGLDLQSSACAWRRLFNADFVKLISF